MSNPSPVVPNFAWLDHVGEPGLDAWAERFFPQLLPREATMELHAILDHPVATLPGLGIEINEHALLDQPPFVFGQPPILHKLDGSITNW